MEKGKDGANEIKGSKYLFGNKPVYNKFIKNIDFPINFIKDQYHRSSYVAAAVYDVFLKDPKFIKYGLNDPNKSYLEGRSWRNTREHLYSFIIGYKFTGESLSDEMRARVEGGEIDITVKGYSKKIAIKALDIFDEMFKYKTYHIKIGLKDLSSAMINPNSVAGFEEVTIGHGLRKFAGSISKRF